MKRMRLNVQIFLWFVSGTLLGTVCCNQMFGSGLVNYSVLYEHLQRGWICAADAQPQFPWKVLGMRLLETGAVRLLAGSRLKRSLIFLFSAWTGACASVLLTILTWSRGAAGFLCFLACMFPHMLFYLASWGMLILGYRSPYEVRKGLFWRAVLFLLCLGVVTEILLNPQILRFLL